MATLLDRDQDLLAALREREPTAAEALITAYGDRAYRLAMRITGNAQDAEEVVQDAFCTVFWRIDDFRGEAAFRSWLFRIVTNAAYNKLRGRRNRRRDVSLDEVLPAFDEDGRHFLPMDDWSTRVNDPAVQRELRIALTAAIEDLPAWYRIVLVLRDVEGLSNAEIAEQLSLRLPTVKTRVHRARLFLRKRLGDAATASPRGQVRAPLDSRAGDELIDQAKTTVFRYSR
jgi:RNA polymerase sigma-70 factor, ECF subfamily